jgi:SAM-dependent methyltransferase
VNLDAFAALLSGEGQALLTSLRGYDPADELATATRLRREHPAELVSAALGQARLRQRGAVKFGADAYRMYFTPDGVEQATRTAVAEHRAMRFAALGARRVADLCCGIGGDAIALARTGIAVLAIDRDPLTCAVARANAQALGLADLIEVRCAEAAEVDTGAYDALFADPARRTGRGRTFDPEAYSPPLSWAAQAARKLPYAAIKVAPGIPHEAIPEDAAAEWISYAGEVKEAVLWFGTGVALQATLLPGGATLADPAGSSDQALRVPAVGPIGRYLYEPDGAVIRAHLVAEAAERLGGRLIDETIAYITSDELHQTPYATAYEITDTLPFHLKKLKALLRERRIGIAVIKKRGSAVEPEALRKKLGLAGPHSCVVILTRVAGAPTVLLARTVPATQSASDAPA